MYFRAFPILKNNDGAATGGRHAVKGMEGEVRRLTAPP